MFLPTDKLLHVVQVVSNLALQSSPELEQLVYARMSKDVADVIARKGAEKTVEEYGTKYRIELYVLTPDEFAQAVQRAAWELYRYGPMRFPVPEAT